MMNHVLSWVSEFLAYTHTCACTRAYAGARKILRKGDNRDTPATVAADPINQRGGFL